MKDMIWEAFVARPLQWITYAISSEELATFSRAEMLLVLLICVTNESSTGPFPGMLQSGDQPMNHTQGHRFSCQRLLTMKDQESWTSFCCIIAKDKVSQCKEHVDLQNHHDETEDPTLPLLCNPSILDQWQSMFWKVVKISSLPWFQVQVVVLDTHLHCSAPQLPSFS